MIYVIKKKPTNQTKQILMLKLKILSHSKQNNERKVFVLTSAQAAFQALHSKLEKHLDQNPLYIPSKM